MQAEWEARGLVRREAFSSRCLGVTWHAQSGKWQGKFRAGGRMVHVGLFDSEREAAAAVVARQRELGLDPDRRQASEFRGVDWHKPNQKWRVTTKIAGGQRHLRSRATRRGRRGAGLRRRHVGARVSPLGDECQRAHQLRDAGARGTRAVEGAGG